MSRLQSTGQLQDILTATIVDLRQGRIENSRAQTICKLAAEVNNSMLAEVAAARIRILQNLPVPDTGSMQLGDALRPLTLQHPVKMINGDAGSEQ